MGVVVRVQHQRLGRIMESSARAHALAMAVRASVDGIADMFPSAARVSPQQDFQFTEPSQPRRHHDQYQHHHAERRAPDTGYAANYGVQTQSDRSGGNSADVSTGTGRTGGVMDMYRSPSETNREASLEFDAKAMLARLDRGESLRADQERESTTPQASESAATIGSRLSPARRSSSESLRSDLDNFLNPADIYDNDHNTVNKSLGDGKWLAPTPGVVIRRGRQHLGSNSRSPSSSPSRAGFARERTKGATPLDVLAKPRVITKPRAKASPKPNPRAERERGFNNRPAVVGRDKVWNEFTALEPAGQSPPRLRPNDRSKTWDPNNSRLNTLAAPVRSKTMMRKKDPVSSEIHDKSDSARVTKERQKPRRPFVKFDLNDYAARRRAKIEAAKAARWTPKTWETIPGGLHQPAGDVDFV